MIFKLLILLVICKIVPSNSFVCRKGWPNEIWVTCENFTTGDQITYEFQENDPIYLMIKNSNISTLSLAFKLSKIKNLRNLIVNKIGIKTIEPGAFRNLTTLVQLDLSQNELTELSNGIFSDLYNLEQLSLFSNKIHKIEKYALTGLVNLKYLFLGNNYLSKIEDDLLKTQKRLDDLGLSGNPLDKSSLETLLSDLSNLNLHRLSLERTQLSTFDFHRMPQADFLILSHNQIRTLNVTFKNASYLYVDHNHLTVLEKIIFNNSKNLKVVDFSFNEISTIDREVFRWLTSLNILRLPNNNITKLDPGLFRDLESLTILDLSHNQIDKFEFGTFDSLRNLQSLNISHNQLIDLRLDIFDSLSVLSKFDFDDNRISSFDAEDLTRRFPSLKEISFNKNLWNCQELVKINHIFNRKFVKVREGGTRDASNVHGVACLDRNISEKSKINSKLDIKIPDDKTENNTTLIFIAVILAVMCACLLSVVYLMFIFFKKFTQYRLPQVNLIGGDF